MVTMNSDKAATKRKPEPNNGGCTGAPGAPSNAEEGVHTQPSISEESPNHLLYKKVLNWKKDDLNRGFLSSITQFIRFWCGCGFPLRSYVSQID